MNPNFIAGILITLFVFLYASEKRNSIRKEGYNTGYQDRASDEEALRSKSIKLGRLMEREFLTREFELKKENIQKQAYGLGYNHAVVDMRKEYQHREDSINAHCDSLLQLQEYLYKQKLVDTLEFVKNEMRSEFKILYLRELKRHRTHFSSKEESKKDFSSLEATTIVDANLIRFARIGLLILIIFTLSFCLWIFIKARVNH